MPYTNLKRAIEKLNAEAQDDIDAGTVSPTRLAEGAHDADAGELDNQFGVNSALLEYRGEDIEVVCVPSPDPAAIDGYYQFSMAVGGGESPVTVARIAKAGDACHPSVPLVACPQAGAGELRFSLYVLTVLLTGSISSRSLAWTLKTLVNSRDAAEKLLGTREGED